MKKLVALGLTVGLIGGAMALPADAKKKAKPVATTFFMEGVSQAGEQDQTGDGIYLKLQATEGSGEKSMSVWGAGASPNTNCAGNSLMPVFVGTMKGTVKGDLTVSFKAAGTGTLEVRVWPDVVGQACNEAYIAPAGSVQVAAPGAPGTVTATIEDLNFKALGAMMIQVTPTLVPPTAARVFYGTADSKVEFTCIPASGKSCI